MPNRRSATGVGCRITASFMPWAPMIEWLGIDNFVIRGLPSH